MVKMESIKRSTITAAECAEYIGCSIDLIYSMVREKKLPHFRIGTRILFKRSKIDEWIEKQMEDNCNGE